MVDLGGQYLEIKEEVNASIAQILETSAFINGPEVHGFQKDLENYLGVKHVIPCANGTDALQIAMMGLGLQPGDEVITADFTFAATVEVIALLQLTPVLVDVDVNTFNIDIEAMERAITPKTKVLILKAIPDFALAIKAKNIPPNTINPINAIINVAGLKLFINKSLI